MVPYTINVTFQNLAFNTQYITDDCLVAITELYSRILFIVQH